MVLQIFISLFLLALAAQLPLRHRRMWSTMFFAAFLLIGWQLFHDSSTVKSADFVRQWLPLTNLKASFRLQGGENLWFLLQSVFLGGVLLIYFNLLDARSRHSLPASGFFAMGIVAFGILFSSADFIQLMAGCCFYTIIGFYLIADTELKKKFIFYNFIGEMALFTAFAVIYAQTGSIALDRNAQIYLKVGNHKDLVCALLLLSVWVKAGLAPFQGQFSDVQDMPASRVIGVSSLIMPVAAIILLNKVFPFIVAVSGSMPVIKGMLCLSIVWSLWGGLTADTFKARILYVNMAFVVAAVGGVSLSGGTLSSDVFDFIPLMILVDYLFLLPTMSTSGEVYISETGGLIRYQKVNLLGTIIGVAAFICMLFSDLDLSGNLKSAIVPVVILLILSQTCSQVYLGKVSADEKNKIVQKNAPKGCLLAIFAGFSIFLWKFGRIDNVLPYAVLGGFVVWTLLAPLRILSRLSDVEEVQDIDWAEKIFNALIIMPVRLLGRVLWLMVDFLFIERTIIGTVSQVTSFLERTLCQMQKMAFINYLLMFLVGLFIFIFFIGRHFYG